MTQPKVSRQVGVVRDRQYATGRCDTLARYYHCTVVQGAVFEEYVFDKARIDVGVDDVAGVFIVVEQHLLLYHYVYLQETCGEMIDMVVTFDGRVLVSIGLLICRKGELQGNKTRNLWCI